MCAAQVGCFCREVEQCGSHRLSLKEQCHECDACAVMLENFG